MNGVKIYTTKRKKNVIGHINIFIIKKGKKYESEEGRKLFSENFFFRMAYAYGFAKCASCAIRFSFPALSDFFSFYIKMLCCEYEGWGRVRRLFRVFLDFSMAECENWVTYDGKDHPDNRTLPWLRLIDFNSNCPSDITGPPTPHYSPFLF